MVGADALFAPALPFDPLDTTPPAAPATAPPLSPEDFSETLSDESRDDDLAADHVRFQRPPAPLSAPRQITPPEERFPPVAPRVAQQLAPLPPPPRPTAPTATTARRRRYRGNWRHDVIAALFLLATLGVGAFYVWIWQNPFSPANPFALPTPFIEVTATPDPAALRAAIATERAENLAAALAEVTAEPPLTPETTALLLPTADQTATPIQVSGALPFALDEVGIVYNANDNGLGCNWASIAGRVIGQDGQPLNGYGIQINDTANPAGLRNRVYSGAAQTFGAGGFELVLGGAPVEGQFSVQLFSQAGVPLSDVFRVVTSNRCDQNVLLLTFVQIRGF